MGFPLIDQPATDISRYFYIASKFIENGINSGGKITKFMLKKLFNNIFPQIHNRKSAGSLHGWNVTISNMYARIPYDFTENVCS